MRRIFVFTKPVRKKLIALAIFALFYNGITLAAPVLTKLLFDEGIGKKNLKLFLILATILLLIGIGIRVMDYLQGVLITRLTLEFTKMNVLKQLNRFKHFPTLTVLKNKPGYFISRLYEEVSEVSQSAISLIIALFTAIFLLIPAFGLSLYLSTPGTLILLFVVPGLLILSQRFSPPIARYTKDMKEEESKVRNVLSSIILSFENLWYLDLWKEMFKRITFLLDNTILLLYKHTKFTQKYTVFNETFLSLAEASVIIISGYFILIGKMTFGGFMAFMNVFWGLIGSIERLVSLLPQIATVNASIERVEEFERIARTKGKTESRFILTDGKIALENVDFSYNGKPVLKDFNLELQQGEKALIMGENGSGKTTILRLIAGLLEPEKGIIKRPNAIALMLSEPLPDLPLKDFEILDQRGKFKKLLEEFKLMDYKNATPSSLSMGQYKKFQILLTLSRKADAYLFDEPLANIDPEMREMVLKSILDHTRGKTLLIVAHDLLNEEVKCFDRKFKLQKQEV